MSWVALAAASVLWTASAPSEPSKKERFLAAKELADTSPTSAPTETIRVVFARNLHTLEIMALEGPGLQAEAYNRFFRCWFTHQHADIPPELVTRIRMAAHEFDARQVRVISGFRHLKYNKMLRKKGREVALRSQHTLGHAIDFALVGVPVSTLYPWLLRQHRGGVGVYRHSGFVHIDTGRKRTWSGR